MTDKGVPGNGVGLLNLKFGFGHYVNQLNVPVLHGETAPKSPFIVTEWR